ncbi:MAG: aminotransferase class IV [Pseudoruegeria sp.]
MESTLRRTAPQGLTLFETMGYSPTDGIKYLSLHLDRLCVSAKAFDIPFSRAAILDRLQSALPSDKSLRVRLDLSLTGEINLATAPMPAAANNWTVAISDTSMIASDPWRAFKSSQRHVYDLKRASLPAQIDELLFVNTRGQLTEGTITNVFVDLGDGILRTPPVSAGVLPGILRRHLIETGQARVSSLQPDVLKSESTTLFVGNALRGVIPCVYANVCNPTPP